MPQRGSFLLPSAHFRRASVVPRDAPAKVVARTAATVVAAAKVAGMNAAGVLVAVGDWVWAATALPLPPVVDSVVLAACIFVDVDACTGSGAVRVGAPAYGGATGVEGARVAAYTGAPVFAICFMVKIWLPPPSPSPSSPPLVDMVVAWRQQFGTKPFRTQRAVHMLAPSHVERK